MRRCVTHFLSWNKGALQSQSHRSFSDSVDLAYQEFPSILSAQPKAPLVIIHGLLGSATNWRTIAQKPEFGQNRRVFAVDLRNHGSSPHDETMNYTVMSNDIVRFLDKHSIDKAVILGHSLGGRTAMATALRHPDRLEKLVVVDIAPYNYNRDGHVSWKSVNNVVTALQSVDVSQVRDRNHADRLLQDLIPDKGVRSFALQNLVLENDQYRWRVNLDAIEKAMPGLSHFKYEELPPFDKPTLFIGGGRSDYILPEHHPIIKTLFPQADIQTIPNAGHWVHVEAPQPFAKLVDSFLQQN